MKKDRWMLIVLAAVLMSVSAFAGLDAVVSFFSSSHLQHMTGHKYRDIYKEEDRSQLIKFSHQYHLTEVGAECSSCHAGIAKSERSSDNNLGKMEACYACHDKKLDCKTCHLEKSEPYSAFKAPKRELNFSHQQHVTDLKMKCETCHTTIATKGYTNVSGLPTMESCMSCHDGVQAGKDCRTCHTDIRFIKPADHAFDFVRTHKQVVASNGDANCKMCHAEETCQQCHAGGNLEKIKHNDFGTSATNQAGGNNNLLLSHVHSLDYVSVHRFDAKAKTKECQSCHETESFCVQCHANSPKVLKPAWHDAKTFVAAGGGMHAQLAKNDMESCVSCHEVPDKDVTCLKCHLPNGKKR